MTPGKTTTWKDRVFEQWDLLGRLVRKRFRDENLADEALLYVEKHLEADDWKRVRAYKDKAKFSTFLSHVVYRLMEDFARSTFGRVRVPKWIQDQGWLWAEVYRLLCMERMSSTDVVGSLSHHESEKESHVMIEEAIALILQRVPQCGKQGTGTVSADPDVVDSLMRDHSTEQQPSPEELLEAQERGAVLEAVGVWLSDAVEDGASGTDGGGAVASLIEAARSIVLSNEERIFLRLVYEDGLKVSSAGRLLGWRPNKAHGLHRRLLARIRSTFDDAGYGGELRGLLE